MRRVRLIVSVAAALGISVALQAQSDTAFIYQGSLGDAGTPASGSFDITVGLWDDLSAGTQIGTALVFNGVPVSDGHFTLELDYGAEAFNNEARWLKFSVDGVTLSPRQPVTRAPYAIQTRGITVDENGFVGIGRTDAVTGNEVFGIHRPGSSFGGMYTSTDAGGQPFYGYDAGTERGWHYMDANGDWRLFLDGDRMIVTDQGNVGIGTITPVSPLHVVSSGLRGIFVESSGVASSGVSSWNSNANGVGVNGRNTSTTGTGSGVYGTTLGTSGGRGVSGVAFGSSGTNFGVYGASNSASGYDFFAAGAGQNYGAISSRRWKDNVEPINNPLHKLAQLRGVYFDWDSEHGGHHDVGFIAEEMGKVMPEIVQYEENGIDAIGMDYSKLTPLLVEALNALRSESNRRLAEKDDEINELRAADAAHAAEISDLQAQLSDLQQIVGRLASNQEEESK